MSGNLPLRFVLVALLLAISFVAFSQNKYKNASVAEVVAQMSLEQKAACVVGLERALFPPTNDGFAGRNTPLPEFGVASYVLADGTAGVRTSRRGSERATAFPDNMALASSWNRELVQEVGAAVSYEAKGYKANVMLAPGINIIRNPLCGRNFEYYSEDPVITGYLAAAYIHGIQSNGIAACIKHFACNNQETNRGGNDVRVSERALREIYLKGFEICTRESDPWTAMTSYNKVNGTPAQESEDLITGMLKNDFGFKGLVMTDWTSPKNTAKQIHAGNDLLMPGEAKQVQDIIDAVKDGTLPIEDLDRACCNVLTLGRKCAIEAGVEAPNLDKGRATAKRAAVESAVLLENRGMLPLAPKGKAALFGVRSYGLVVTGSGAGFVSCPPVSEISSAFKNAGTQIDAKLEDLYTKYIAFSSTDLAVNHKVKVHIGYPLIGELDIAEGLVSDAAENNDYAIITIGRTAEESKERTLEGDFNLTDIERKLIGSVCSAFHAKGKKVAVVLNISGIIETQSWKHLPDAILNIWLPGEEGGNAVYSLLSGEENPSGRLSVTFTKDYFDYPSAYNFPFNAPRSGKNYDYTDYSEGIYVGYRYFATKNIETSYPFGHGLSYTKFILGDQKAKATKDSLIVTFSVKNVGSCAGKNAVGIYVNAPKNNGNKADLDKPAIELKGFSKTRRLEPGEVQQMRIVIAKNSLSSYDENKKCWALAAGRYNIYIGDEATLSSLGKCNASLIIK